MWVRLERLPKEKSNTYEPERLVVVVVVFVVVVVVVVVMVVVVVVVVVVSDTIVHYTSTHARPSR